MKTLAILSRKGGSGKSTFAVHLAVAAEKAGHTAALIDLDPQASAVKWSRRREGDSPVVISAHSTLLAQVLETAEAGGVSFCILDTSPHSESAALDAARVSDLAVIPSRPAIFDLEAVGDTIQIANMAKVPIRVVLNGVKPSGSVVIKARKALEMYDVRCAPCTLGDRVGVLVFSCRWCNRSGIRADGQGESRGWGFIQIFIERIVRNWRGCSRSRTTGIGGFAASQSHLANF